MAYCRNCGKELKYDDMYCTNCGASQSTDMSYAQNGFSIVDRGGFGWGILGFIFPVIGLVLYLVWRDNKPRTARAVGMGALTYLILVILFIILLLIFINIGFY